jgi:hypothetical protein
MSLSRKPARRLASWLNPRLALEALEARDVPATLFVDDSLVAGATVASLGGRVTIDRDAGGTLTAGDQVTVALGETGQTANLTFGQAATGGDAGSAFGTIQAAVTFATAGDTIKIATGTYAEAVNVTKQLTLQGLTGTAADVVVDPAAGVGITVAADGVVVRDLRVTGATDGIAAPAAIAGLTVTNVTADANTDDGIDLDAAGGTVALTNVRVTGNTGNGLELTGTAGSTLTVSGLTATGNTGAGLNVTGFPTVNLTDLTLTGNTAASTLTTPAGGTVSFTATTGTTPYTITASGTQLQVTRDPAGANVVNQPITLAGETTLNLTGGAGIDRFVVTPSLTGGAVVNVTGGLPGPTAGAGTAGDVLDLDLTGVTGTTVTSTFAAATGFSGTVSFTGRENVTFTGIESFADGASISGRVFNDANGNGSQNGSEGGLAGVTVQLDVDANGTADLTTTTDAAGNFSFTGLPPGTYRVRIVTPTGGTLTTALPPDVTAVLGGSATGLTFGVQLSGTGTTGTSTVTGVAFNDANNNGVRDAGEIGVNGLVVYLDLNGNGKFDKKTEPATLTATVNGVAGSYTLTSNAVGTSARVRVVEKPGFLENTTSTSVVLTDGATQTVDVGVRADLPPQATPARRFAVGEVVGNAAKVRVFGPDGKQLFQIPVPGNQPGGVRVAVGDVTGDGVDDVIIGSGPGVQALVTVIDGATQQEVFRINPFDAFTGGVFVTVGDVNGDGVNDIVVTPDEGGGPRVVVLRGGDFSVIASFFGIDDPGFRGGARAGIGDINGDGRMDLLVSAGFGGGPRMAVFDGKFLPFGQFKKLLNDFFVFPDVLRNGVYVGSGDVNGDGFDDLIIGAGPGGGPQVLVLSGQVLQTQGVAAALASPLASFFGGNPNNRGGIRVAVKDLDGDGLADILTGDGSGTQVTAYGDDFSERFRMETESDDNGRRRGAFVG